MKPTKPIQTVFIHATGDPSAGIPHSDFEAGCWILPDVDDNMEWLEYMRMQFVDLYSSMTDQKVTVMFDFEHEAMCKSEQP